MARNDRRPPAQRAIKGGWRSGLEEAVAKFLNHLKVAFTYEKFTVKYTEPETRHRYTPDFILPNGIIVETKGRFQAKDRKKHKLVKAQHPDLDIRFVFSRSQQPINKQSHTTYAKWCKDHGFLYADRMIPMAWINEPKNGVSWAAIKRLNVKVERR